MARCFRLQKQCLPSDSVRKRTEHSSRNANVRINQLEGKLDSIMTLLQTVTQPTVTSASSQQTCHDEPALSASGQEQLRTPAVSSNADAELGDAVIDSPTDSVACSTTGSDEYFPQEADTCLATFRTSFLPHFPFLDLAPYESAQQLHESRPFLLRAICAVTRTSTQEKLAEGRKLKQELSHTMIVENQSSLDLLLGLMTFLAWGNDHFLNRSASLSRLMQQALSLVYDLRLNKPLPREAHMLPMMGSHSCRSSQVPAESIQQDRLEEQRALLGCFWLSSVISCYFAQMDAMRWTPRMEEFLGIISTNAECPMDASFALHIRLQQIAQKTVQLRERRELDLSEGRAPAPAIFYLKALEAQLEQLRPACFHYIELSIYETALTSSSEWPLLKPDMTSLSDLDGVEGLWRSLTAAKSWFDVTFTLSPAAVVGQAFIFWAQAVRCTITLYRLSTLNDPAWDRQAVRNTADVVSILERFAGFMHQVQGEAGEESQDDFFHDLCRILQNMRAWVGAELSIDESCWSLNAMNGQDGAAETRGQAMQPMDEWMDNLFGRLYW
ncbi:hypothetical protein Daus18300_001071 [Diaporthe australafricana]|uniref:C6 transcription factor n=1 Tax=Diaporthe australafricana TaxID=127596 RepID=A0ABR3XZX5_9PEZI